MNPHHHRSFQLEDLLFFVLFFLWFSLDFLYSLEIQMFAWGVNPVYLRLLSPLKHAVAAYILLFRRYSVREWLIIAAVAVLLFFSARRSGYYDIFYAWLFVTAAKRENVDRTIDLAGVLSFIYVMASIILSLTGLIPDTLYYRGEMIRHSFGFPHPNQMGFRIFIMMACMIWRTHGKMSGWSYLCITGVAVFVWLVANSRTACASIMMLALLGILRPYLKSLERRKLRSLLVFVTFAAAVANLALILVTVFYVDSGIMRILNKLLSDRLAFGHEALMEFGTSFLGQIAYLTRSERAFAGLGGEIIVDSIYGNMILRCGMAVFLLVVAGYIFSMLKASDEGDYLTVFFLAVMACYGTIEQMAGWPMWNVFLVLLTDLFPRSEEGRTIFGHCKTLLVRRQLQN